MLTCGAWNGQGAPEPREAGLRPGRPTSTYRRLQPVTRRLFPLTLSPQLLPSHAPLQLARCPLPWNRRPAPSQIPLGEPRPERRGHFDQTDPISNQVPGITRLHPLLPGCARRRPCRGTRCPPARSVFAKQTQFRTSRLESMNCGGGCRPSVDLLQAPDADGVAAAGGHGLGDGSGGAHRGDARKAMADRGTTDRLLVAEGVRAGRCVDDQLDRSSLHQIYRIGPALVHLEDGLDAKAGTFRAPPCPASRPA